ncbi:MAG: hypothetical protein CMH27_10865 [Micavibrio sp.]|nr:hypothetical protein [Micavibrio sp.]|tara:strand:+ start:461 stop:817 length:357 start_codon:yes stop_codon:yes gene_type:complete
MELKEKFTVHGYDIALNSPCFVTGKISANAELCLKAYVTDIEAGERIVQMFNGHARLDKWPYNAASAFPQVEVAVSVKNQDALCELQRLTSKNENVISREIIEQARQAPANQPSPLTD